jgi:hypothetical protein
MNVLNLLVGLNSVVLIFLVVNVFKPFFGSYAAKKGENLATKEDIAQLTKIAEGIKAKISDEVWDRQEQWKLKRDAILEAIRSIAAIKESLAGLNSCFCTSLPECEALKQKKTDERNAFKETNSNLWCAKFVAEIVVGTDLNENLYQFYQEAAKIAVEIMNGDSSYFNSPEGKKALADKTNAVIREARKELGIPDRGDLITSDINY